MMSRWLAVLLMLTTLPSPSIAADHSGVTLSAAPMRRDITLDEQGVLKGRTSPDTAISFRRDGYEKHIRSGPDGGFSAQILPGVYLVHVGDLTLVCRAWGKNTSPPCATDELVLSTAVVRGQNGQGYDLLRRLDRMTIPAIIMIGAGVAGWAAIDGNSAS